MFVPMRTSEHHSQTLGGDVAERGLYSSDARMWRSGRKSVEDLDVRSQESRKAVTQACEGRPIPSQCYARTVCHRHAYVRRTEEPWTRMPKRRPVTDCLEDHTCRDWRRCR